MATKKPRLSPGSRRVRSHAALGRAGDAGRTRAPTRRVAVLAELAAEGPDSDRQGLRGQFAVSAETVERRFDQLAFHLGQRQARIARLVGGTLLDPGLDGTAGQFDFGRQGTDPGDDV